MKDKPPGLRTGHTDPFYWLALGLEEFWVGGTGKYRNVLLTICRHYHRSDYFCSFVGVRRMAKESGCSPTTLYEALDWLEKHSLIERVPTRYIGTDKLGVTLIQLPHFQRMPPVLPPGLSPRLEIVPADERFDLIAEESREAAKARRKDASTDRATTAAQRRRQREEAELLAERERLLAEQERLQQREEALEEDRRAAAQRRRENELKQAEHEADLRRRRREEDQYLEADQNESDDDEESVAQADVPELPSEFKDMLRRLRERAPGGPT